MNHPNQSNSGELDELLRQVDDLLAEPEPQEEVDIDQYAPADLDDEPILYQNYSNHYGADLRNYYNGYGGRESPQVPQAPAQPSIPAYNADFKRQQKEDRRMNEYRDYGESGAAPVSQASQKAQKIKKKRGCGCGCTGMLLTLGILIAAVVLAVNWLFTPPRSEDSIGERKPDTAAVLICGTDWEGARTDTMMLMYLSGSEHKVSLLSLPRDTYTITSGGYGAKLNSAYGRNGSGAEGMEGLLDYVQEIIGFRPDGYILVDMDLVPQIVDVMGGVDVEVPQTFDLEGEHLEAGYQHLTGSQVLQLLRFREGYAMQDLGRIEVQRSVIKACLEQWVTLSHLTDVREALSLVENNSLSTLNWRNYLWMAKVVLTSMDGFTNDTLPGYATYIGDVSYYVLYRDQVAELINERYNPYRVTIDASDLKIAG